jgi:hypothetical protein
MLPTFKSCSFVQSFRSSGSSFTATDVSEEGDLEERMRRVQPMLREIITYLESKEYANSCGFAGGIEPLKGILDNTKEIKQLTDLCKDRMVALYILGRMLELNARKFDPLYRNPWEMTMLSYLHAITQARKDLTSSATLAAGHLKNTFWIARYIEQYIF